MSDIVQFVLKVAREIRGEAVRAGTVMLEGEIKGGFNSVDIEKALKRDDLAVYIKPQNAPPDSADSAPKATDPKPKRGRKKGK